MSNNYVNPVLVFTGGDVPDIPVDAEQQSADEQRIAESDKLSADALKTAKENNFQRELDINPPSDPFDFALDEGAI